VEWVDEKDIPAERHQPIKHDVRILEIYNRVLNVIA